MGLPWACDGGGYHGAPDGASVERPKITTRCCFTFPWQNWTITASASDGPRILEARAELTEKANKGAASRRMCEKGHNGSASGGRLKRSRQFSAFTVNTYRCGRMPISSYSKVGVAQCF